MRLMLRATLVLLLLVSTAATFDLDSLLVESVGGPQALERLSRMENLVQEGRVVLNGIDGSSKDIFAPPDKYFSQMILAGVEFSMVLDGDNAWKTDMNGNVTEVTGFERDEALSTLYIGSYAYITKSGIPGDAQYRGIKRKDGQDLHQVTLYPMLRDTVEAFFDPTTARLVRYEAKMSEVTADVFLSDYRQVEGVWIAFKSKIIAQDAPLIIEGTIERIEFDAKLGPDAFARPGSSESAVDFPEKRRSVSVPMDYRAGHVRVLVTINGKTGWMILDTGASTSMIDQAFVADMQLESAGALPVKGLSGYQEEVQLKRIDSMQLGQMTLRKSVVAVIDLEEFRIHGPGEHRFAGILGYNFLSSLPIMIDYQGGSVTAFNPDTFEPSPNGFPIPFEYTMNIPTVEGSVLGIPGKFLVDLGNPYGLILHGAFVDEHNLMNKLDDVKDHDLEMSGVGGKTVNRTAFLSTFRMGDILFNSMRVVLAESEQGVSGSERIAGNIGNMVLEGFRVLLDYPRSQIVVYKGQN